jgi:hypothetical protein
VSTVLAEIRRLPVFLPRWFSYAYFRRSSGPNDLLGLVTFHAFVLDVLHGESNETLESRYSSPPEDWPRLPTSAIYLQDLFDRWQAAYEGDQQHDRGNQHHEDLAAAGGNNNAQFDEEQAAAGGHDQGGQQQHQEEQAAAGGDFDAQLDDDQDEQEQLTPLERLKRQEQKALYRLAQQDTRRLAAAAAAATVMAVAAGALSRRLTRGQDLGGHGAAASGGSDPPPKPPPQQELTDLASRFEGLRLKTLADLVLEYNGPRAPTWGTFYGNFQQLGVETYAVTKEINKLQLWMIDKQDVGNAVFASERSQLAFNAAVTSLALEQQPRREMVRGWVWFFCNE